VRLSGLSPRPLPIYNPSSPWSVLLLCFCHRRHLAPPLAAAAAEPPPATQTTLSCSPRPRASSGPPELAFFPPKSPRHPFSFPTPATKPPHVASSLHCRSELPVYFAATTVSSCCSSCFRFRRYRRGSLGHRSPWPPFRHGRRGGSPGVNRGRVVLKSIRGEV
jgi:hypothetical protein